MSIERLFPKDSALLAPMYKVTDMPFRLLCKQQGAAMVFSEMANAEAIKRNNKATFRLLHTVIVEKPVGVQIFGAKPNVCAEATVKICEDKNPCDLIDFNLGCPVRHIRQQGAGAALLLRPKRVSEIIKAMVDVSDRPVSAKIRSLGSVKQTVQLAKTIEKAGAEMLTIHARTVKQMYSGSADLAVIKAVKQALGIIVVGNGGINCKDSMEEMLSKTGCDAVMIGREAIDNPAVFAELQGRQGIGRIEAFYKYLELAKSFGCENFGYAKLHAVQLVKHRKNHALVAAIERSKTTEEITAALQSLT